MCMCVHVCVCVRVCVCMCACVYVVYVCVLYRHHLYQCTALLQNVTGLYQFRNRVHSGIQGSGMLAGCGFIAVNYV